MQSWLLALVALFSISFQSQAAETLSIAPEDGRDLFYNAIDESEKSIDMMMYHMTDKGAAQRLLAAHERGVQIRIILDAKAGFSPNGTAIADQLKAAGIEIRASSPLFSISHAKAANIDHKFALITTINLTRTTSFSRDYGIRTDSSEIIEEYQQVFNADWNNALDKTSVTPALIVKALVWSPINAKDKILALLNEAKKSLLVEVENLGDRDVLATLKSAVQKGVLVSVIVPGCVFGTGGSRNVGYMKDLALAGVEAKLSMPPYSAKNPYIHSKSIVVDGDTYYVGSENLSYNSLTAARELGIIKQDAKISAQLTKTIEADLALAKPAQDIPADFVCPEQLIESKSKE